LGSHILLHTDKTIFITGATGLVGGLFALRALAVFIITRAFLISLTHLGPNPHEILFDHNNPAFRIYDVLYNTHHDFFFSSHTGLPFLLALVFWPEKIWRYFFIAASIFMGVSVLLGHIHYSIDVFAAPFMTYSIFALSRRFFPKDYQMSRED